MGPKEQLARWIEESPQWVFFGGAGVSTESGIPDFRSENGLYRQKFAYPPEVMLSRTFFDAHPREFFDFYREKMIAPGARPNAAHKALAAWEKQGRGVCVVTQNIDGLHQMAGSRRVWELHGSVHRNFCMHCGKEYPLSFIQESQGIPRCSCGGIVKPDVVLYEEGLSESVLNGAVRDIAKADLLIVAGTSLTVYPAAGLLQAFSGRHMVVINRTPTPADKKADLLFSEPVGQVLEEVAKLLEGGISSKSHKGQKEAFYD